jgi:hypothetical protein
MKQKDYKKHSEIPIGSPMGSLKLTEKHLDLPMGYPMPKD